MRDGRLAVECCCEDAFPIPPSRPNTYSPIIDPEHLTYAESASMTVHLFAGSDVVEPGAVSQIRAGVSSFSLGMGGVHWRAYGQVSLTVDPWQWYGEGDPVPPPPQYHLIFRGWALCGDGLEDHLAGVEIQTGNANVVEWWAWNEIEQKSYLLDGSSWFEMDASLFASTNYPARKRVDIPESVDLQWTNEVNDPGWLRPNDGATVSWTTWPEDGGGWCSIRAGLTEYKAYQAQPYGPVPEGAYDVQGGPGGGVTDPTIIPHAYLTARTGEIGGVQGGQVMSLTCSAFGLSPEFDNEQAVGPTSGVTVRSLGSDVTVNAATNLSGISGGYVLIIGRVAPPCAPSFSVTKRGSRGAAWDGPTVDVLLNASRDGVTQAQGSAFAQPTAKNYSLVVTNNFDAGFSRDYIQGMLGKVWGLSLDPDQLYEGWLDRKDGSVAIGLDSVFSWAAWVGSKYRWRSRFEFDDGTSAVPWTAARCALVVNAGHLEVTVSDPEVSGEISRELPASVVAIGTASHLAIRMRCLTAGGQIIARVGAKQWTRSLTGTGWQWVVIPLCRPDNFAAADSAYHSRYRLEWDGVQGGAGYGVDNRVDRSSHSPTPYLDDFLYPSEEQGNHKAAYSPTLLLEFACISPSVQYDLEGLWAYTPEVGVLGFDHMWKDANTRQGQVYEEFMGGEPYLWDRYGGRPSRKQAICIRGWWAEADRLVLDEVKALGFSDGIGRRKWPLTWIASAVWWNRWRVAGKGCFEMESGVPWVAVPDAQCLEWHVAGGQIRGDKRHRSEGGTPYSWPAEFCNDAQLAQYMLPVYLSVRGEGGWATSPDDILGKGWDMGAALWTNSLTLNPGISWAWACDSRVGGQLYGVSGGAVTGTGQTSGRQVTGSPGASGAYSAGTTLQEAVQGVRGAHSGQVPHGDVMQRESFP